MPTDLTDRIAIVVAGVIGVLGIWEYRRLARRWPGRGGRRTDTDPDHDGGDGDGEGDGGNGDGGDGGGGD